MNRIWIDFIIAGLAWGSGWLYGSSGSWNEGYERGKEAMQLMLQGDPMTTDKVAKVYDWDRALKRSEPVPNKSKVMTAWDHEELTPRPFKRRLSMIEGGQNGQR